LERLGELHPAPDPADVIPPLPAGVAPSLITIDSKTFHSVILRLDNGSGPGISGWTGSLLRVAASDKECANGLKCITQDIANGLFTGEVRDRLLASRLIPLRKPNGDIRPIAIGEVLYRMAALYTLSLFKSSACFKRIQYGVGLPGGVERALHIIDNAMDLFAKPVVITTDWTNAFNTRSRADIITTTLNNKICSPIHSILHWSYAQPSNLHVFNRDGSLIRSFLSQQGVRQGDPLASLAFSLSVQSFYEAAVDVQPGRVLGVAVADDFYLVGNADDALQAYSHFNDLCIDAKFALNTEKCKFHAAPPITNQEVPFLDQASRGESFPVTALLDAGLTQSVCLPALGSLICRNSANVSHILIPTAKAAAQSFANSLVSAKLPLSMSLELLALCGIPRFRYHTRVLNARVASELSAAVEAVHTNLILRLVPQLASLDDSQRALALEQLSLPKSLGGMALTKLRRTTTQATIASCALVVQDLLEAATPFFPSLDPALPGFTIDESRLALFKSAYPRFSSHTANTLGSFADKLPSVYESILPGAEVPVPVELDLFLELFQARDDVPVKFQHKLQNRIDHTYNVDFLSKCTPRDHARILSCSHPISSSAFGAFVEADGTRGDQLCDADFRIGLLMRLGVPVSDRVSTGRCQLCKDCPDLALDPCHPLSCRAVMSVATSKRHNRLVTALGNFAANRASCLVRRELTLVPDRRLRPDLEMIPLQQIDTNGFLSDVEVTRADSTSYLARSRSVPGHAADAGAASKIAKYSVFANGRPILPLVFEAHGHPSKLALKAIELISKSAETAHPPRDDEPSRAVALDTTRSLFHLVSYHLHAGNGVVVRAYLQLVHQRDPSFAYADDPQRQLALSFLASLAPPHGSPELNPLSAPFVASDPVLSPLSPPLSPLARPSPSSLVLSSPLILPPSPPLNSVLPSSASLSVCILPPPVPLVSCFALPNNFD
jgi:hypothetical protein